MLNVGSPEIAFSLHQYPAAGVGLVREEFIISNFIKIHPLALLNKDSLNKGLQDKIDYHIRGYNTGEDYFINKLALFSFVFILASILIAFFAPLFSTDKTPMANQMYIELKTLKPYSKVFFLEFLLV